MRELRNTGSVVQVLYFRNADGERDSINLMPRGKLKVPDSWQFEDIPKSVLVLGGPVVTVSNTAEE